MPIYAQTYRSYEGTLRPHFRWLTMVRQELRVLFSRRMFIFLILLGNFHFALRILQVFVLDVLSKQQEGFFGQAFGGDVMMETGAWVYFDFMRMQSPLIFVTLIYAGSGLICNDVRNNLMEIYFSKPLNWRDYVMGKVGTLVAIGMALSCLPVLFLGFLHVLFLPTASALRETLALTVPSIAFPLVMVLSFALPILACSALIGSSRFAAVTIYLLAFMNLAIGVLFALLIGDVNFLALAFPVSLNDVGELMFHDARFDNPVDIPWVLSVSYVAVLCLGTLTIICAKIRQAEVGR